MTAKPRFNPYIVGQLTLLLGGIALGLAILPAAVIKDRPYPSGISTTAVNEDTDTARQVQPFRIASMTVALLGLCIGPIGWIRERPPLLPATGMGMCAVALFWYWIVLGVTIAAAILLLFVVLAVWSGGF